MCQALEGEGLDVPDVVVVEGDGPQLAPPTEHLGGECGQGVARKA